MDIIEGIKSRRSIRKFSNRVITDDIIEQIIDVTRFSPSWKNTQIPRYTFVSDKSKIQKIATDACVLGFNYNVDTLKDAPYLMIISYLKGRSGYEKNGDFTTSKGSDWEMFDSGIAAQTFCLAAHSFGIGTVIMGIFDEDQIRKEIQIPQEQTIACLIPMGYPLGELPTAPPRKEVDRLLTII